MKVGCLSEGTDDGALLRGEERPGSIARSGAAAQQVAAELAAAVAAVPAATAEEALGEPADIQPEVPNIPAKKCSPTVHAWPSFHVGGESLLVLRAGAMMSMSSCMHCRGQ